MQFCSNIKLKLTRTRYLYQFDQAGILIVRKAHSLREVLRLDLFKATAARTSSLNASSSTSSPS